MFQNQRKENKDIPEILKPFEYWGVEISSSSKENIQTNCVFCGKEHHFYINTTNGLWDCKSCGASGNLGRFLWMVADEAYQYLFSKDGKEILRRLSYDRKLPKAAFKKWKVGYHLPTRRITIPIFSFNGGQSCVDIRHWKLPNNKGVKYKVQSTRGALLGLGNGQYLKSSKPSDTIYIAEGEWDGMALDYLLDNVSDHTGRIVVAVPGANTFKQDWLPYFAGRKVQTIYDNDTAGEAGELIVDKRLQNVAKKVGYIRWLDKLPLKFDLRDWIAYGLQVDKPVKCWKNLQEMFINRPRTSQTEDVKEDNKKSLSEKEDEAAAANPIEPLTNAQMEAKFRKWLYLPDKWLLDIIFGVCFANRLEGDPVWMFLVAPPGGSKSELLMSLTRSQQIYPLTSLTPHTLISGAYTADGKDPSLLPKIDGKVLVLKDFTTITSMNQIQRDEIFGILRDIYDGKTEKEFGTGVRRSYNAKFGILAGVTPVIESFASAHQSLGERFLKYRLPEDTEASEETKILKAIGNVNKEIEMRAELQAAAAGVLCREIPDDKSLPYFSEKYLKKIVALAMWAAWIRGVVERDRYTQNVAYKPYNEVGTRLAKQLTKLAMGVAIYRGKREMKSAEYETIKAVAFNSCPQRYTMIIRAIHDFGSMMKTQEVAQATNFPQASVFRMLEDLTLLGIIVKKIDQTQAFWALSEKIKSLIIKSEIFSEENKNLEKKKLKIKRKIK